MLLLAVAAPVAAGALVAAGGSGGTTGVRLDGNGLGVTTYGATVSAATKAISAVLGNPTGHPAAGCTGRYEQTAWHDLVVQFVAGRFRGYRYLAGGTYGAPTPAVVRTTTPRLATPAGITLGSSLAQTRRAYEKLRPRGTDFYATSSGITFAFWASGNPLPESRIYEIKSNVCPSSL